MTTSPAARRLLTWTAPPLSFGALALVARASVGVPAWVVVLSTAIGGAVSALLTAVTSVLPALLPQESEHRRDAWRDWLKHRERMARLHIAATDASSRPETAQRLLRTVRLTPRQGRQRRRNTAQADPTEMHLAESHHGPDLLPSRPLSHS
ncbi:hypothetical protein ACWGA9_40725 [Streptomyces sp. NPDC054950]